MTKKEQEILSNTIEDEGFEYAMLDYSNWDQINDDDFHEALIEYREATEKLKGIIGIE